MMAGGVPAGAGPAPANPTGSKSGIREAGGQGTADTGFHALLGGALPAGAEDGTQAGPAEAAAPALPESPLPDAGADDTAPEAPIAGGFTLAEQVLALIGVSLPRAGAANTDPEAALPADGNAHGLPGRHAGATAAAAPGIAGAAPNPAALTAPDVALAALQGEASPGKGLMAGGLPALPELASTGTALPEADPGAAASLLAGQPSAAPPRAPTLPPALAAPLPMPADPEAGFDDGFGARIGWLAGQQIGRADIRLNPEHLGVVDIRLDLDGSRVSVELASASHEVRQALEASLGRLREMLEQQGLDLARADVGAGQREGHGANTAATPGLESDAGADAERADTQSTATPLRRHGLLDEYA